MGDPRNKERYYERLDHIRAGIEAQQQADAIKAKIPLVCSEPSCNAKAVIASHKGSRVVMHCAGHAPDTI